MSSDRVNPFDFVEAANKRKRVQSISRVARDLANKVSNASGRGDATEIAAIAFAGIVSSMRTAKVLCATDQETWRQAFRSVLTELIDVSRENNVEAPPQRATDIVSLTDPIMCVREFADDGRFDEAAIRTIGQKLVEEVARLVEISVENVREVTCE